MWEIPEKKKKSYDWASDRATKYICILIIVIIVIYIGILNAPNLIEQF